MLIQIVNKQFFCTECLVEMYRVQVPGVCRVLLRHQGIETFIPVGNDYSFARVSPRLKLNGEPSFLVESFVGLEIDYRLTGRPWPCGRAIDCQALTIGV